MVDGVDCYGQVFFKNGQKSQRKIEIFHLILKVFEK